MARSAAREAVVHYQAAIALLEMVEATQPGDEVELGLRLRLGNAAFETEGFTSARANESYYPDLIRARIVLENRG